jgi:N-acetyl-anhydromuramyl-L-alanine amidase AmpD/phage tail protein X
MTFKIHVVGQGDSLSKIIKKYYGHFDTRLLDMVAAANGLADPDRIRAGRKLKLPGNWGGAADPVRPDITDMAHSDRATSALVNKAQPSDTPRAGRAPAQPGITQKSLPAADYWKEAYHKDLIVLHFTAGYTWEGAYAAFKQKGRVATPFIVAKSGAIYRLFDERCWAYHLGIPGRNAQNHRHDKRSIGIEIVNIGPVWRKGGKWVDYMGKSYSEAQIVQGKNRDAHGGVAFPADQVQSVCSLVNWLLTQYRIPRRMPADFMSCQLPAMCEFRGVATHQMFRKDKYDMGPAFPYRQLIETCGLTVE